MSAAWRRERVATFTVSCTGKTHTIHVLRSGGLQLANHECDYRAWLIDDMQVRALVPADNKCVALWRAWRTALAEGRAELDVIEKPKNRQPAPAPEKAQRAFQYVRQLRQV